MNGTRKLKGFYATVGAILILAESALLFGVQFTGDNIIALVSIIGMVGGAFFGANFGEWWAQSRKGL